MVNACCSHDVRMWRSSAKSSTVRNCVSQVIRKPDEPLLALFLGIAIGVMSTVSIVELLVKNALENDPLLVLGAFAAGTLPDRLVGICLNARNTVRPILFRCV